MRAPLPVAVCERQTKKSKTINKRTKRKQAINAWLASKIKPIFPSGRAQMPLQPPATAPTFRACRCLINCLSGCCLSCLPLGRCYFCVISSKRFILLLYVLRRNFGFYYNTCYLRVQLTHVIGKQARDQKVINLPFPALLRCLPA